MNEEKQLAVEKGGQQLAPLEEEQVQDYTVPVILFFGGSVPMVMLSQVLGLGMPGFVAGAVLAGILAATGKPLLSRLSGLFPGLEHYRHLDWTVLLRPLDDEGNVVDADEVSNDEGQPKDAPRENETQQEPTPDGDFYADLTTHMDFGKTLRPDANKVLSGRKVLFGVSDAGKSNNVAVILEEYGRFGAPLFLFDTEGEYKSLVKKTYLPMGIHVTRNEIKPDQAYAFAQWAIAGLKQVVIDLSTYDDDEAGWMMINIIKGVRDFEESNEIKLPVEIILDEATVWLPQNPNQSTLNKVMVADPDGKSVDDEGNPKPVSLLSLLERAFFSVVVRRGRKRGMGFTLATQRIAELNKSALSANWVILMRQTQAADFKVYKEYGITPEQALSLSQGEAFIFALGKPMERHQFRLRRSPHGAATPGLKELRQHQQRAAAQPAQAWNAQPTPVLPELAEDEVDALLDEMRGMSDIDADDSRYEPQENEPIILPLPARKRPALSPDLQATLDAYHRNPGAGLRKLGEILGVSKDTVNKRLETLRAMRLI